MWTTTVRNFIICREIIVPNHVSVVMKFFLIISLKHGYVMGYVHVDPSWPKNWIWRHPWVDPNMTEHLFLIFWLMHEPLLADRKESCDSKLGFCFFRGEGFEALQIDSSAKIFGGCGIFNQKKIWTVWEFTCTYEVHVTIVSMSMEFGIQHLVCPVCAFSLLEPTGTYLRRIAWQKFTVI